MTQNSRAKTMRSTGCMPPARRVRVGARREPPGRQLAARPRRVRPRAGHAHRRSRCARVSYGDASDRISSERLARLNRWKSPRAASRWPICKQELQTTMQNSFGVFRTEEHMQRRHRSWPTLRERIGRRTLRDKATRSTPRAWRRWSSTTCWRSPRRPRSLPKHARRAAAPTRARTTGARRRELAVPFAVFRRRQSAGQAQRELRARRPCRPSSQGTQVLKEQGNAGQRIPVQPGRR